MLCRRGIAAPATQHGGDILMDLIERFEVDRRNRLVENLGRTSPNPRILPMRSVLMCLKDT